MSWMATWSSAVRMTVVMVFLLGMPILALPVVQESLHAWRLPAQRSEATETATAASPRPVTEQTTAGSSTVRLHAEPLPASAASLAATASHVEQLKQRFVRLGATYMVLERVGVDSQRYRFRCDLPLAAGSPYVKQFETVSHDAALAMRQTLRAVESWQLASRDTGPGAAGARGQLR